MIPRSALAFLLTIVAVQSRGHHEELGVVGGYEEVDPNIDPIFKEMAEFALEQRPLVARGRFCAVFEMESAATQMVAGQNYNVTFTTALTDCLEKEIQYTTGRCPPADTVPYHECTALVYDRMWKNHRELTSLDCRELPTPR